MSKVLNSALTPTSIIWHKLTLATIPLRSTTTTPLALTKTCPILSTANLACLSDRSSPSSVLDP